MDYLRELVVYLLYYGECLAATLLFLYHKKKRDKFAARTALAVAAGVVTAALISALYGFDIYALTVFKFIAAVAPLFLLYRCYDVKFTEILFAVIFSTVAQHWANVIVDIILMFVPPLHFALEKFIGAVFFAAVLAVAYPIIIKQTVGDFDIDLLTVILLCVSIFTFELSVMLMRTRWDNIVSGVAIRIFEILFGFFIFWTGLYILKRSKLKAERIVSDALLDHEREQFEQLKRNADAMQSKLHDLKYIMRTAECGSLNDDTLTQWKEIGHAAGMFEGKDIAFSCVTDETRTDFIDSFDLYSILGNAFDNAAEYLSTLQEKEKRYVECSIRAVNRDLLCISVSNYFERSSDVYVGMATTKSDKNMHGFGLKTIEGGVEKYGGVLSVCAEDNEFRLTAAIPIR